MEDMEWIIGNMFLKELGKEEQNILMEHTGEQFVMIQNSTWQQLMFFVDLWIQNLVPLAGQMLEICLIAEAETFLMVIKNQFWWMMFLAQVMKHIFLIAHTDLLAIVDIMKM